ncbi:MAG TPA: hypothetical protein VEC99_14130 [Clostridia bacterium]|nr:hypothetical protein [Clostridia bacterium]
MRVLLLNTKSGLYYQSPDTWTAEADSATDFGSSLKAAVFAQEQSLENIEVCLDFGDSDWNVHLPVQARSQTGAR